jgi:hypothetical protein
VRRLPQPGPLSTFTKPLHDRHDHSGLPGVNYPDVTQAEAEAGVVTDNRSWSPLRVKQAIDALGGGAGALTAAEGYMGFPVFRNPTPNITAKTDAADETADFEEWHSASSSADGGQVEAVFMGRLCGGCTTVKQLDIAIKGGGTTPQFQFLLYTEGSGAVNQYTGTYSTAQAAPGSRTLISIVASEITNQPTGEGRYILVVRSFVDTGEIVYCGTPFFRQEA